MSELANLREIAVKDGNGVSSKLCEDAIADAWGKAHNEAPALFEERVAQQLHMVGASKQVINDAYMHQVEQEEIHRYGQSKGEQVFLQGVAALGCRP